MLRVEYRVLITALSMCTLFHFTKRNRMKALIAVIIALFTYNGVFAQVTGKAPDETKKEKKKLSVRVSYPEYLVTSYEYVEKTEVERIFRDSVKKNFRREVKWYVTERVINEEKGEITMTVNIDSVEYDLYQNGRKYHYNSQKLNENNANGGSPDWIMSCGLLNRMYKMVIGANGIVKSVGRVDDPPGMADIGKLEDFLNEQSNNMSPEDSATIYVWRKTLRADQCDHLGNIARGIIPGKITVMEDSVWKVGVPARLNWVNFVDSMDVQVVKSSRTKTVIEGVTKSLRPLRADDIITHDVPGLCTILGGRGSGRTTLTLNQRGRLNAMESEKNAEIRVKYNLEEFTEKIKQTISCNMIGRDKW